MKDTSPKTVLLIDDDNDLITINKIKLEQNGFTVLSANNGKEGVNKALSENPDLIVLDVMMTYDSEGFEVSRTLRSNEQTKKIPIILLTSVNETVPYKFEPDETYLPVNIFLEKPISPDALLKEVRKILS